MRRDLLFFPLLLLLTINAHSRPNIVFILIDDMGWPDVACYGHAFHETPNIDRLCAQGMKFTDFYAATPVCSSTRSTTSMVPLEASPVFPTHLIS